MNDSAYRLILTGELLPGFEREGAVNGMARLFNQSPEALRRSLDLGNAPLNYLFTADEAFQTQNRLERMGVRSRIERTNHRQAARHGNDPTLLEPGKMRCPACGQVQMVSTTCAACEVNFEDYNRQRREGRLPATSADRRSPEVAIDRHLSSWQQAAGEFEDEVEPDEQDYLAWFVGRRHANNYLPAFGRYRDGERLQFAVGWNWGAVFSPFLWAMRRKLWFWALVMLITEIVIPATLIILGTRAGVSGQLATIGGVLLVVNRIVWPALANLLYYRHARATIQRLERLSATRLYESDILEAGGVSYVGALIGLCMAVVAVLFSWNLIDSLGIGKSAFERGEFYAPGLPGEVSRRRAPARSEPAPVRRTVRPGEPFPRAAANRAPPPPVTSPRVAPSAAPLRERQDVTMAGVTKPNKWVATRSKLRDLGSSINDWLAGEGSGGVDPMTLTGFKLREKLALDDERMADAWGSEIQFIPSDTGYRLISAGPDQLFGTADDLQYAKVLKR